jgi:hypothetical protein
MEISQGVFSFLTYLFMAWFLVTNLILVFYCGKEWFSSYVLFTKDNDGDASGR